MNRPYPKIPKYAGSWPDLNIYGSAPTGMYHTDLYFNIFQVKLKIRIHLEIYRYYDQRSEWKCKKYNNTYKYNNAYFGENYHVHLTDFMSRIKQSNNKLN